ncbi:hypothetical protein D3C85_1473840 [compost metagenome]
MPGFEAQVTDHGLSFFQRVQVTDMVLLAESFTDHRVDDLADLSDRLAAVIQFVRNGLAFADQGEIVIEYAGQQLQFIDGQMGL